MDHAWEWTGSAERGARGRSGGDVKRRRETGRFGAPDDARDESGRNATRWEQWKTSSRQRGFEAKAPSFFLVLLASVVAVTWPAFTCWSLGREDGYGREDVVDCMTSGTPLRACRQWSAVERGRKSGSSLENFLQGSKDCPSRLSSLFLFLFPLHAPLPLPPLAIVRFLVYPAVSALRPPAADRTAERRGAGHPSPHRAQPA